MNKRIKKKTANKSIKIKIRTWHTSRQVALKVANALRKYSSRNP